MGRCYRAAVAGEISSQELIRHIASLRHLLDLDEKLGRANLNSLASGSHAHAHAYEPRIRSSFDAEDAAARADGYENKYERQVLLEFDAEERKRRKRQGG